MVNDSYALDWMNPKYPRKTYSDRLLRGLYYCFLRKMEGMAYPRLDALIANSRHVRKEIIRGYSLDAAKVCVIHPGLRQQSQDSPLPLTGSPAILFVGGNFLRKGLPLLLQATATLRSRFPDIHLHVVGKDHNQPALAALAARLNLTLSVTFHGRQPNDKVRRMMAGADIFALPSVSEGFGLVYLEAMQAGTPVIATRIGGASEVFVENSEAVFVDPRNVGEMAQAIEKIASDKTFEQALREGGRKAASRLTVSPWWN
jgi:glycosyltransferase involved in cell wall biosynthesis